MMKQSITNRKKSEPYAQGKINWNVNELEPVKESSFYSFFNPRGKYHRFVALFFMCWLGFASNFCYDNPSAIQDSLMEDLNITSTQFSLLYSIYAWPSIIICVIGGVLIDSLFGIRMGTILYMGITLIGQLVYAAGALIDAFWVMVLGRFIFGIGSEPLGVAQKNYAVSWFEGNELNMVFGLHSSCNSIASVLNFWTMDPLYTWVSKYYSGYKLLGVVLFIGSITCIYSMICSVILGIIDKKAADILKRDKNNIPKAITFKDVKNFHWSIWLLIFIRSTGYVTIYSFLALSKVFFMSKFHMTSTAANHINSLMFISSIIGAPVLGMSIDKVGRNIYWLIFSATCLITAHCMLALFSLNPCIPVILLSISSSILSSAFWPIIALTIPNHQLGTAYGLCWSSTNFFLITTTIIAGSIVDYAGYFWLEAFFIFLSMVSFLATMILLMADGAQNGVLNMTPLERELHKPEMLVSVTQYQEIKGSTYPGSIPADTTYQSNPEKSIRS